MMAAAATLTESNLHSLNQHLQSLVARRHLRTKPIGMGFSMICGKADS